MSFASFNQRYEVLLPADQKISGPVVDEKQVRICIILYVYQVLLKFSANGGQYAVINSCMLGIIV